MVAGIRPAEGGVILTARSGSQESADRNLAERLVWVAGGLLHFPEKVLAAA